MELETTKIEIINGCWIRVHNRTCNLPVSNFYVQLILGNALERHRSISAVYSSDQTFFTHSISVESKS